MASSKSGGPAPSGSETGKDSRRERAASPPADEVVGEADEESFPASDAPGWITQTTIGPPARKQATGAEHPRPSGEERSVNAEARRIIVTESDCHTCTVHTVYVHHQSFPELRIEDVSAERAALHLANRLEAARAFAADPLHREAVRQAIDDVRAFLDREGTGHTGRDTHQHPMRS
jgi:hypothetical protein